MKTTNQKLFGEMILEYFIHLDICQDKMTILNSYCDNVVSQYIQCHQKIKNLMYFLNQKHNNSRKFINHLPVQKILPSTVAMRKATSTYFRVSYVRTGSCTVTVKVEVSSGITVKCVYTLLYINTSMLNHSLTRADPMLLLNVCSTDSVEHDYQIHVNATMQIAQCV